MVNGNEVFTIPDGKGGWVQITYTEMLQRMIGLLERWNKLIEAKGEVKDEQ